MQSKIEKATENLGGYASDLKIKTHTQPKEV